MMTTRAWQQYPTNIELKTELGVVYLSVTDANHIYIDGGGNGKFLTVRGVKYSCSLHLHRIFQEWQPYYINEHGRQETSLYMRKYMSFKNDRASDSAQKKVIDILTAAVRAWASENAALFGDAQAAHVNNEVMQREEKIREHESAIRQLKAEIAALKKTLA